MKLIKCHYVAVILNSFEVYQINTETCDVMNIIYATILIVQ